MTPMYSMWEVHQLVSERQAGLMRDAGRQSLGRLLKEAPKPDRGGRTACGRWDWLTTLLDLRPSRGSEAVRR